MCITGFGGGKGLWRLLNQHTWQTEAQQRLLTYLGSHRQEVSKNSVSHYLGQYYFHSVSGMTGFSSDTILCFYCKIPGFVFILSCSLNNNDSDMIYTIMLKAVPLVIYESNFCVYFCKTYRSFLKYLNVQNSYHTLDQFVSIIPIADIDYFLANQAVIIS